MHLHLVLHGCYYHASIQWSNLLLCSYLWIWLLKVHTSWCSRKISNPTIFHLSLTLTCANRSFYFSSENLPDDANYGVESISSLDSSKKWVCPWGHTVVDDVAPQFRSILEENCLSTSMSTLTDTQKSRFIWWTWRTKLNNRLDKFLRLVCVILCISSGNS